MSDLTLRFWGVRGSIAAPGPATAAVGGNTSCVEIRAGTTLLILDMGSGLRPLGESLAAPVEASFLCTHYHWDHICGLPFFAPAYDPRNRFTFYGSERAGPIREVLAGQMRSPYFPVELSAMRSEMKFVPFAAGQQVRIGPVAVKAVALNHPGGALGWRLDAGAASVVYATDFEHGSDADEHLASFARGAGLLIYDATYTPDEYAARGPKARKGWGHSTWKMAVQIAKKAAVRRLALFHHDPARDDGQVAAIEAETQKIFPASFAAREGQVVKL